jgi:hypothetical protein
MDALHRLIAHESHRVNSQNTQDGTARERLPIVYHNRAGWMNRARCVLVRRSGLSIASALAKSSTLVGQGVFI